MELYRCDHCSLVYCKPLIEVEGSHYQCCYCEGLCNVLVPIALEATKEVMGTPFLYTYPVTVKE